MSVIFPMTANTTVLSHSNSSLHHSGYPMQFPSAMRVYARDVGLIKNGDAVGRPPRPHLSQSKMTPKLSWRWSAVDSRIVTAHYI